MRKPAPASASTSSQTNNHQDAPRQCDSFPQISSPALKHLCSTILASISLLAASGFAQESAPTAGGAAAGASIAAQAKKFQAVAFLRINKAEPVPRDETIGVSITVKRGSLGGDGKFLPQAPGGNEEEFPLTAYIFASKQLEFTGKLDHWPVVIKAHKPASSTITFNVLVNRDRAEDTGEITVLLFYKGYPCAKLVRENITFDPPLPVRGRSPTLQPKGPVEDDADPQVALEDIPLLSEGPDMTVTVVRTDDSPLRYRYCIQARKAKEPNGSVELWSKYPEKAEEELHKNFAEYSRTPDARQALDGLRQNGANLYLLAPARFRQTLAELKGDKFPKSILIFSDEPHIPWELLVPPASGKEAPDPLGAKCAMGRWVAPFGAPVRIPFPERSIKIQKGVLWAPQYYGDDKLDKSGLEHRAIDNLNVATPIQDGGFAGLVDALHPDDVHLLHLICHGSSANANEGSQSITGQPKGGDRQSISVSQLTGDSEFQLFCQRRPLIFLNACQVGQTIPTMTGAGGFAPAFVKGNAGAVIAPLWSVLDTTAGQAAAEFYTTLSNKPNLRLAEIIRDMRAKAYKNPAEKDTISFAAYCFYGDPLATVAAVPIPKKADPPK
ncbi:MAG TPA: CHAT domain-containing protein [Chthoniobacteraceae bacterium]|jgi:hypothetical protein|nr:CHAT domain-containing protein [Chthoniobacteraceae bacterium]